MIRSKIRVFIVEDSLLYQTYLRQVIESDGCLSVVGTADRGDRALELIPQLLPDVITLDLNLPDMDGLSLLETIVHTWDIPVIVVSGDAGDCERAIVLGARDFIEKMQDAGARTAEQFRLLLKLKLKMQADLRPDTARTAPADAPPAEPRAAGADGLPARTPAVPAPDRPPAAVRRAGAGGDDDPRAHFIAIGASLGGTEATLQILRQLPKELPGIVIVQHMPAEFTAAYALRLDSCCALAVREAKNGDAVLPGTVLVAKGGEQLTVCRTDRGFRVKVGGSEKYGGFCPSVDVMFRSAACAGPAALGVILTGMGRDGAEGLKQMHDAGAYTLGQDEESCAVFGMPCAARNLGAVDRLLGPDAIAGEIVRYCSRYKKSEADGQ